VLGWEHTFIHTLADLLHALAGTQAASPDFADGVCNQRVMGAIEQSSRSRAWRAV
jgi:hypothetical protein